MDILIINGHDYSRFIESKGYGWSREDLDGDKAGRTKDGIMRRQKIATKRKLSYTMMNMSREELAQLDDDLSPQQFSVVYHDLHGKMTKTFYCSSFSATMAAGYERGEEWGEATFNLIEV